ncbi:MAG: YigZ family protein [Clostridia bacterium]|nr:YigZ family protein [Clostridia bacterium]MBR6553122.1 YigZ family protein [Clostridia bacterium]
MSAGWTTVKEAAVASFIERKSEFIGSITPVKTEEEAIAFVNSVKKQYADAKHNVYAYLLRENNVTRFSDDGEPHGTAGLPVLDVLRKEGITDVAVVVTRYFGGILLGTGGLVRAYSQAAKMALDAAGKSTMEKLLVFSLRVNYSDLQKIEPILENYTMIRLDTAYADDVRLSAAMREGEYPALEKALTERTNGRAILKLEGEQFAAL